VGILINFEEELKKVGLTPESYEAACEDIDLKSDGVKDLDWSEIKDKYNIPLSSDSVRKASYNGIVI
jgi:flavin-binding protein dodecin